MAPGTLWTASAMLRMSVIVPRILLVWVHVTNRVRFDRSRFKVSTSSFGLLDFSAVHHLIFKPRHSAICTQDAMFASWSSFEMINSSPALYRIAKDKLRKSCVVEAPTTDSVSAHCQLWIFSSLTDFIGLCIDVSCCRLDAAPV